MCGSQPYCRAWDFALDTKACWLKNSSDGVTRSDDRVSGISEHTPHNDSAAFWRGKRRDILRTIWDDGKLPTRTGPDYVRPSNYTNVTWFVWDITQRHPMNATGWFHPIAAGARSRTIVLMHEGHSNSMSVDANFSAWVHATLGCDYLFLWMPLYGPNQQHGYPPHHSFFPQWQAQGDKTMRYFVEPTALAVNWALAAGYEEAYVSGLSGGGWTTTLYAALDPRVPVSLPLAGSLPWYLFADHQVGDYEQRPQEGVSEWYLSVANFTELYLLAALEPGRTSVQVLHEHDPCCFHAASRHDAIRGYGARVGRVLGGRGGTFSSAVSDWDVHEWDMRSRAIVAAALREATARPDAPQLDHLPCDILQHAPDAVPCPW